MNTFLVRVFYLGHRYYGSQCQPGLPTVQGELIAALTRATGEPHSPATVHLSGRTDRGVHSFGQVALIKTNGALNIGRVNHHLPDDITIWAHAPVSPDFNVRNDVLMRHYRYYLSQPSGLDIYTMRTAARILIGTNDYTLLARRDGDRDRTTTLLNISITTHGDSIVLDFYGVSFLWHLVRKIVSLLTAIGQHEYPPEFTIQLLSHKRTIRGGIPPAPPECLVLVETIVPFHMQKDKYALRRIRNTLVREGGVHFRSFKTLSFLTRDFFIH